MPAPDDSPSSSPADVTAVSPPPADAAVVGPPSADLTAVGPPSADVTAGGPPPADQPGLYTAKLGRFGVLTLIGALSWAVPAANFGTLSQALFADMDPANKIAMAAVTATVSSVGGALAVIVAGLASDRTRSRWGKRKPWMMIGALFSALCMAPILFVDNFAVIVALFTGAQVGLNTLVAALSALLPDRVGQSLLGRASAMAGLGNLLGGAVGGIIAAGFLPIPTVGLAVVPWLMVLAAAAVCVFLPTIPSQDVETVPLRPGALLRQLAPPADRDFWLVFASRVLFLLGLLTTFAYQLYILTDYFEAAEAVAQQMIALAGAILAVGAGVFTVVMGPLSDKVGRRKPFVIGAGVWGALGVALLLTVKDVAVFPISIAAMSMAYGTFISVDQALMVEVLPNRDNAARDLGFLTVANTAPGILAPGLAGLLVTLGGYPAVFVGGIVLTALSGVFLLTVKRVR